MLLTCKNSITGIEYRNDPTIFAWELINEPRCLTDISGDTLQVSLFDRFLCPITLISQCFANQVTLFFVRKDWINKMTAFIKSIDKKHLLTVGLEGGPLSLDQILLETLSLQTSILHRFISTMITGKAASPSLIFVLKQKKTKF